MSSDGHKSEETLVVDRREIGEGKDGETSEETVVVDRREIGECRDGELSAEMVLVEGGRLARAGMVRRVQIWR